MKILIAEDEPISRLRLKSQLVKWGYDVIVAKDGAEAWEILQQDDPPRLAILDWMMPGMDGTEICRRLRAERAEPYVYVILLTGRSATEDLVLGLDAGADDYVRKPFEAQEMQVRLRVGRRMIELQTELVAAREALRFQATHDPLTGALNRAAAMDTLRREIARADRGGAGLAVAMVDLDRFKSINDTHGHTAGDDVLREAVRRMLGSIRAYDTLARYGGEEFILILPSCDDSTATIVGERIRECLAGSPMALASGAALAVTCSVGIASFRSDANPIELISRADRALYRAKHSGRNRVEVDICAEAEAVGLAS